MNGKLRNMTAIYLFRGEKVLLLFRKGGKVVDRVWTGSAGGHFEENELNDPTACVLREMKEELGLGSEQIADLTMRYVTLRDTGGEIRQNYYFFATLADEVGEDLHSNEGELAWFSLEELDGLEMGDYAEFFLSDTYNILKDQGESVRVMSLDVHTSFGTPAEYREVIKPEHDQEFIL